MNTCGSKFGRFFVSSRSSSLAFSQASTKAAFREEGREANVTDRVRVSQYSPRYWKVRVDAVG